MAQVSTPVTPSFVVGTRFCYRPKKGVFNPIDYPCDHRIPRGLGRVSQTSLVIRRAINAERPCMTLVHQVPDRRDVDPLLGSDLGTASCRDQDSDRARPDWPTESLIDRDVLALKGLTLAR